MSAERRDGMVLVRIRHSGYPDRVEVWEPHPCQSGWRCLSDPGQPFRRWVDLRDRDHTGEPQRVVVVDAAVTS